MNDYLESLQQDTRKLASVEDDLRQIAGKWIWDMQRTLSYLEGKRFFYWYSVDDDDIREINYWTIEIRRGELASRRGMRWTLVSGWHQLIHASTTSKGDYLAAYVLPPDLVMFDFEDWTLRSLKALWGHREEIEKDIALALRSLVHDYEELRLLGRPVVSPPPPPTATDPASDLEEEIESIGGEDE